MIKTIINTINKPTISITIICMFICVIFFCSNSPFFEYNVSNNYFDENNINISLTPWYFHSIVIDTSLVDINDQTHPIVTLFFKKESSNTNTYKNIDYKNSDFFIEVFIDTNQCAGSRWFGTAKCIVIFNSSPRTYYSDIQRSYYCTDTGKTIHAVIEIDSTKLEIAKGDFCSDYIWQAEIHKKNGTNLILPAVPFRIGQD